MKVFGVCQARSKFSTLVGLAFRGQTIGVTRHGKLTALIVPVGSQVRLEEIFRDMDENRKRSKMPKGVTVKDLIEEGRI